MIPKTINQVINVKPNLQLPEALFILMLFGFVQNTHITRFIDMYLSGGHTLINNSIMLPEDETSHISMTLTIFFPLRHRIKVKNDHYIAK